MSHDTVFPAVGRETFTSPPGSTAADSGQAIWLFLHWRHGLSVLDIVVLFTSHRPVWDAAEVEILAQPRGESGLPVGELIPLLRQRVALRLGFDNRRLGSLTLPRSIAPEVARDCFYRVHACL